MAYMNGNEVLFSGDFNIVNVDVVQKTGQSALAVMSQKAVTDTTNAINKRVINLEHRIDADLIYTDNGTAYQKDVPAGALPYAAITKIGGMTYKDAAGNLQDAKTTAIKSVGANKFTPDYIIKLDNLTYADGVFSQIGADTREDQYFKAQMFKDGKYLGEAFQSYLGYVGILKGSFTIDGTFDMLCIGFGGMSKDTTFDMDITNFANGTYYFSINCTNITQGLVSFKDVMISTAENAIYSPYMEKALAIPAAVQAIEGYGQGVNENCYNFIEWKPREGKKKFNKCVDCVDLGTLNWTGFGGYFGHTGREFKPSANVISALPSPFTNIRVDIYGALVVNFDEGILTSADDIKAALSGVMLVYERATPDVTDISDILPDDNILKVEGGGTVTFENEGQNSVPSEIIYNLS